MTLPAQSKQIETARIALIAARTDPAIAAPLAELGFTPAKLSDAWALYESAAQAFVTVKQLRADQLQATRELRTLRRTARQNYASAVRVAKVVLSDTPAMLTSLMVSAPHKRGPKRHRHTEPDAAPDKTPDRATTAPAEVTADAVTEPAANKPRKRAPSQSDVAWADRARMFYTNAIDVPEIQAQLAEVGYPISRLQAALDDVARFERLSTERLTKRVQAGMSYGDRREKLRALRTWLARFNAITTAAWHDQPELLDKLGFKARGRKRK